LKLAWQYQQKYVIKHIFCGSKNLVFTKNVLALPKTTAPKKQILEVSLKIENRLNRCI